MQKTNTALPALALALCACATNAADDALKPFPAAQTGEVRHVIELPSRPDEALHKVELIAGKTLEVDCNQHRLGGQWVEKTVDGWGYTYHRLEKVGPPVSTLMACPENRRHKAFVTLAGEAPLLRYNSKLPLVVYAPKGVEVRYRIWSAAEQSAAAAAR